MQVSLWYIKEVVGIAFAVDPEPTLGRMELLVRVVFVRQDESHLVHPVDIFSFATNNLQPGSAMILFKVRMLFPDLFVGL